MRLEGYNLALMSHHLPPYLAIRIERYAYEKHPDQEPEIKRAAIGRQEHRVGRIVEIVKDIDLLPFRKLRVASVCRHRDTEFPTMPRIGMAVDAVRIFKPSNICCRPTFVVYGHIGGFAVILDDASHGSRPCGGTFRQEQFAPTERNHPQPRNAKEKRQRIGDNLQPSRK